MALLIAVLAGRWLIAQTPDRIELGPRTAAVRFETVDLDPSGFAPLRLAGAWAVSVDDPRFGGISALALDGRYLLALSDAGVVVRLPRPGEGHEAALKELPDGPGDPHFKRYRDSEALLRDPGGAGWLVAFENRHSLWTYDARFRRALGKVPLTGRAWDENKGVEGMAVSGGRLLLFPEVGSSILALEAGKPAELPLLGGNSRIADAATLPDGRMLVLLRQPTLRGFRNSLGWLHRTAAGYRIGRRISLGVGPFDNMEAVAAESTASGTRLWVMSDNNFHNAQRTLLLALDL